VLNGNRSLDLQQDAAVVAVVEIVVEVVPLHVYIDLVSFLHVAEIV